MKLTLPGHQGVRIIWLCVCRGCTPSLPIPFEDKEQAEAWHDIHTLSTGHEVDRYTQLWTPREGVSQDDALS